MVLIHIDIIAKTGLAVQYNNCVFLSDNSSVAVWQDSSSLCEGHGCNNNMIVLVKSIHHQRYSIIQISYIARIFGRLYYICCTEDTQVGKLFW